MTITEISVSIAAIAVAASVSINAYNFIKESRYIKNKYIQKGYKRGSSDGYSEGFYDGLQFMNNIIPPQKPSKKKK